MAGAIALRKDFDGKTLRGMAKCAKDASQARRLLALASIYDGGGLTPMLKTRMRPWDWFLFEGRKIHFEYRDEADGVLMVSLSSHPRTT